MISFRRGFSYLRHNHSQFCDSIVKNFLQWLPDRLYLSFRFRCQMGYWINWKNPKTFTEKLQWLKVYNRKPEYTSMVDKYAVKEYVANIIGEEYIIPTLGVWDKPEEIDWDSLPQQFVLKTTHGGGGGGVVICKNKETFNKEQAVIQLNESLRADLYREFREWPYKNVPRRIIAEKYMAPCKTQAPSDLPDYKFFCYNGEPKFCQVIRDRHSKETIDFYDMDWTHQEFVGLNPVARNGLNPVARPIHLDEMIDICRKLAKDIPFVRVDLYVIDDKEYFGELTLYPASGLGVFTPEEWSLKLGDLLMLPNRNGGGKFIITDGVIRAIQVQYDELKDYKFFCFNGKVKFFKVDFGRFVDHHANYYSLDGNLLDFGEKAFEPDPTYPIELPENLNKMISLAEKLAMLSPFLRVDLYNIKGKIYFGELTFYPSSGFTPWTTEIADEKIGGFIVLPKKGNNYQL